MKSVPLVVLSLLFNYTLQVEPGHDQAAVGGTGGRFTRSEDGKVWFPCTMAEQQAALHHKDQPQVGLTIALSYNHWSKFNVNEIDRESTTRKIRSEVYMLKTLSSIWHQSPISSQPGSPCSWERSRRCTCWMIPPHWNSSGTVALPKTRRRIGRNEGPDHLC